MVNGGLKSVLSTLPITSATITNATMTNLTVTSSFTYNGGSIIHASTQPTWFGNAATQPMIITSSISDGNAGATQSTAMLSIYPQNAFASGDWVLSVATAANAAELFNVSYGGNVRILGTITGSGSSGNAVITLDASTGAQLAYSTNNLRCDSAKASVNAGTGTGRGAVTGMLDIQSTPVGNVGGGEDDLHSYSLPANSLITTNRGIRYYASGTLANNVNAKTINIYFGASMIAAVMPVSIAGDWEASATIIRTGSSAQRYHVNITVTNTTTNAISGDFAANGTLTQTETGAITIKATGTGVSNNDIVQNLSTVEYI